jgi:hypothetical protein
MGFLANQLSEQTSMNTPQLHAHADNMMTMANQARLTGQPHLGLISMANLTHQVALAKSDFSSPESNLTSPIHERVTPHLIKTKIHTGISSPGMQLGMGMGFQNPNQAPSSDIVGGGQSALSSL